MGRALTITIPAAGLGVDPVPVSVSGDSYFSAQGQFEVAYDPADFASNAYFLLNTALSNVPVLCFPMNTILWVRAPPASGQPASDLSVLTSMNEGVY
jgi:hypothetical protein